MKCKIMWLFLWILVLAGYTVAQNFPFPQNVTYPFGIRATNATQTQVQAAFTNWMTHYYEEQVDLARVRFDDPALTVSEGIAYGMLIMVFMDNTTNNTRPRFDRLWNYYQQFMNSRGVMHWRINGFSNVTGENGATDAELDAALALIMADRQWGGYRAYAEALVNAIWTHQVIHSSGILKPGDAWDTPQNASYFSSAAIELFKEYDRATHNWDMVLTAGYAKVDANAHNTTGLTSDWCDPSGTPQDTDHTHDGRNMHYDGVRTPWRMAWAHAWFGHATARNIANRVATWVRTATSNNPANIGDGYTLAGERISNNNNATFVGTFAAAGMVDASHQAWVNAAYSRLASFTGPHGYFNTTLQVLYMLTLSGNMPLMTGTATTPPTTPPPPVGNQFVIDDCEDGDYASLWGGEWYTYNDAADGGATVVTPLTTDADRFVMATSGHNSTRSARMQFTLNQGTFEHDPFAGIGVNMRVDEAAHDMTGLTSITYTYRGAAHAFRIETTNITDFAFYQIPVAAATTWTTVTITVADFLRPAWAVEEIPLDLSVVRALSWQVQGATGLTGTLEIDNVISNGAAGPTGVTPPVVTPPTTPARAITATPASLSFGAVTVGQNSTLSYTLSASNLTPASGNIVVTAPAGFGVSLTQTGTFTTSVNVAYTGGALAARSIWVRFSPTAAQSFTGNVTNTGGGATAVNVAVTGTGQTTTTPPVVTPPPPTGGNEHLVDDGEDNDPISNWGGAWFTYSDATSGGASTVTPAEGTDFTMSTPGHNSSYAARMSFTLDRGTLTFDPFVGLGLNMRADEGAHDMSGLTAVTYSYMGSAHTFRIQTANITNHQYFEVRVPASTSWTTVTFNIPQFAQPDWGTGGVSATLELSRVVSFGWQIQAASGATGSLAIDNVISVGAAGTGWTPPGDTPPTVSVLLQEYMAEGYNVQIGPTPFVDMVEVFVNAPETLYFGLYDVNLRPIERFSSLDNLKRDWSRLPRGVYFLVVKNSSGEEIGVVRTVKIR